MEIFGFLSVRLFLLFALCVCVCSYKHVILPLYSSLLFQVRKAISIDKKVHKNKEMSRGRRLPTKIYKKQVSMERGVHTYK